MLEAPGQRVAGIEVKASANVDQRDFSGLRALAEAAGEKFAGGVVLYLGEQRLAFADDLWVLPIAALWQPADTTPSLHSPTAPSGLESASSGSKPVSEKLCASPRPSSRRCAENMASPS